MNLERFQTHKDVFDLLDMRAHFAFKTAASVGFNVGPIPRHPGICTVFGSIQVHHPSSDHIQTQIYLQLPGRYREPGLLIQVRKCLFSALGIPEDETFELHYTECENQVLIANHTNREGFTDEILA